MPEFIDPVFAKTSPKCSFLVIENERFRLVFAKAGSINSGTGVEIQSVMLVFSTELCELRELCHIGIKDQFNCQSSQEVTKMIRNGM